MTLHFNVAVIGAGASGVLVAAHYDRIAPEGSRLALIDAGARAARGLAYGTPYGAHLLNVRARGMTAFNDDPEHFMRWLRERLPASDASTFAPRRLYGDYLHDVLAATTKVTRVGGTSVGLTREDEHWIVHLHDDQRVAADSVVLGLGNLPPSDPLNLGPDAPPQYVRDPWAAGVAVGMSPDAPVLMIGTGLTMIDLALALRAEGHRGTIQAISRHGRLPLSHATLSPLEPPEMSFRSPRDVIRWIRNQAGDVRAVIDSLRPVTQSTWSSWTVAQRASFLRHARSIWDVHRHRMAPEVAEQIYALQRDGFLRVSSGRIEELREVNGDVEVKTRKETLRVARVINCTGPATDYARLDLPLVVQMRRAGWLTPDPLRLGVETAGDGSLIGKDGAVPGLFTLGPLRRPALWESTAIPEIRAQAESLAIRMTVSG